MINTKLYSLGQLLFLICLTVVNANWGTPGSGQYHIQTDEGPERYFRYQTDSGQYRKEKRLQDGTVIGTDAWIDALGFLRQNDYIADDQGYRLLKSKTVYVGKGRPIQEAIKAAKKQAVKAVHHSKHNASSINVPKKSYASHHTTKTTTVIPIQALAENPLGYDHYKTPITVDIRPHSQPHDSNYLPPSEENQVLTTTSTTTTQRPLLYARPYAPPQYPSSSFNNNNNNNINNDQYTKQIPVPLNIYQPPFNYPQNQNDIYQPIAIYQPSSTPASPTDDYGTPLYNPSTTPNPNFHDYVSSTTPRPPNYVTPLIPSTNIDQINNELAAPISRYPSSSPLPQSIGGYPSSTPIPQLYNQYIPEISQSTIRPPFSSNDINNNNNNVDIIQPIFNRNAYASPYYNRFQQRQPHPPSPQQYYPNNQIGNGYDKQFSLYDGVSTTANGFRYYLPRHYHEEENIDGDRKAGSFGYIDPFGIRRVIYYNASPEGGFVHRKNNRYVGFNATPYDPRPL